MAFANFAPAPVKYRLINTPKRERSHMRRALGRTLAALVCFSIVCLFAYRAGAQDDKKAAAQPSADQMKQMQEMMKAIQPGPEHEKLKEMAGNWDADVKFYPPEAPGTVQESK